MSNRTGEQEDKKERSLYEPIKSKLEELFNPIFNNVFLEITADGNFSNKIKKRINNYRDIVFIFLKRGVSPDITGYVDTSTEQYKNRYGFYDGFVIAEIKNEKLDLEAVYQARKYGELFEARYAFLISTEEIPEEIKRLSKAVFSLLQLPAYVTLTLVQYKDREFVEWFPNNPFDRK